MWEWPADVLSDCFSKFSSACGTSARERESKVSTSSERAIEKKGLNRERSQQVRNKSARARERGLNKSGARSQQVSIVAPSLLVEVWEKDRRPLARTMARAIGRSRFWRKRGSVLCLACLLSGAYEGTVARYCCLFHRGRP